MPKSRKSAAAQKRAPAASKEATCRNKPTRKKKAPIPFPADPPPNVPSHPSAIVRLARAFQAGEDCAAPLHDALLEHGFLGPAGHFSGPHACRPGQGCLVVAEVLDPQEIDPEDPTSDWSAVEPEAERDRPIRYGFGGEDADLTDDFRWLCADLEGHGVARLEVEYDASGDNGAVESCTFFDRHGEEVPVDSRRLLDRVADLAIAIMPGGWDHESGSLGTVTLNTLTRRIYVDHQWRIETIEAAPFAFEL